MHDLELRLLAACREAVRRQHDLASALADHLRVPIGELLHGWVLKRFQSRGTFDGGEWRYFFHGMECDLAQNTDGRMLRLDFGPGGRVDTFCGWGILRFVLHTRKPWEEFDDLKSELTDGLPQGATDFEALGRLGGLLDQVKALGWVGLADPDLFRFAEEHTRLNAEGIRVLTLPEGSPERLSFDVAVCHRLAITPQGYRVLGEEPPSEKRAAVVARLPSGTTPNGDS